VKILILLKRREDPINFIFNVVNIFQFIFKITLRCLVGAIFIDLIYFIYLNILPFLKCLIITLGITVLFICEFLFTILIATSMLV